MTLLFTLRQSRRDGVRLFARVIALCACAACFLMPPQSLAQQGKPAKKLTPEEIKKQSPDVLRNTPKSGGSATDKGEGAEEIGTWTIAVMLLAGEKQDEAAENALAEIRTSGQLPDATTQERTKGLLICVGEFDGPDDPRATAELARIQNIEIDGVKPYEFAWLAPPTVKEYKGSRPEWELSTAKAVHGKRALYTLQVGAYGRLDVDQPTEKDRAEVRAKAEEAVLKLRQEGEEAYYHHGQRMSIVTVGVFDEKDFDPQVPSYKSARLRELQKRYPHNLYNGAAIRETLKGGVKRLQPSNLVNFPE
jgi:hypothetical protein